MNNSLISKLHKLQNIKKIVESYNIEQQEDILNIIREGDDISINENKNGFFINLTNLNNDIITKIEKYMEYIILQENHLTNIEFQKKEYEQILNS
tara:strand:- start:55 stop:339 length:285 start_codon:yes stop_codon:yes gene_type:complete